MKTNRYQRRFYRDWIKKENLFHCRIVIQETDVLIITDKRQDKNWLKQKIERYRKEIQDYIAQDRGFLVSLKPVSVSFSAPTIVKKMAEAARKANVGPMAAVAGAIADSLGRELNNMGCEEIIIENGGDIYLQSKKERKVGIYAGENKPWRSLAFKISPLQTPLGICTSSGILGHSLSFGSADAVVILAVDGFLADAVATATANQVQKKEDLEKALVFARSISGIKGVVIVFQDYLASWGEVEFVI